MENFLITSDPIKQGEGLQGVGRDLTFVDPQQTQELEDQNTHKQEYLKESGKRMQYASGDKNAKFTILLDVKKAFPDISLIDFCKAYAKTKNADSIDDAENFEISENVEDYFLKKFRRRVKKLAKKVTSTKVGKILTAPTRLAKNVVTKYNPVALAVSRKARRATLKDIKKAGKDVGKVAKMVAGYTVLLPLRPLLPAMRKGLKAKGYSTSKSTALVDVATQFFKRVINGKKQNANKFEELDDNWYENDPMFYDSIDNFDDDHIAVTAVVTIVTTIITYFKKVKEDSKKNPESLSTIDREMGKEAGYVNSNLQEKAAREVMEDNSKAETLANGISQNMILLIGGAVLVAVLVLKK